VVTSRYVMRVKWWLTGEERGWWTIKCNSGALPRLSLSTAFYQSTGWFYGGAPVNNTTGWKRVAPRVKRVVLVEKKCLTGEGLSFARFVSAHAWNPSNYLVCWRQMTNNRVIIGGAISGGAEWGRARGVIDRNWWSTCLEASVDTDSATNSV